MSSYITTRVNQSLAKTIGNRLRGKREHAKLSIDQLARRVSIDSRALRMMEQGEYVLTVLMIYRLVAVLDCTATDILGF